MSERKRWNGTDDLNVGHVVRYEYCRGTGHSGVAVMRGRDGFEYWMKTLDGDNHFGTRNFVVTVDVNLSACSHEDFTSFSHR